MRTRSVRGARWASRRLAMLVAALVPLAACGYHFSGAGAHVPTTARTIAIKPFVNHTRERGLEVSLQRALEEEFRRRSGLKVVDDGSADLVLSGTIRRFTSTPVAFGATDEALRYQGSLAVAIRLRDRESGRVLFHAPALEESLDFAATPNVVITSSPRFQQDTLDPDDLVDLPNVQLGETRRREAMTQLVDLLARDVYLQAMEGF